MPREMQRDEIYPAAGYEVAARISVTEGGGAPWRQWVVVFHNNSTHYFVAWQETPDDLGFVFVKSYRYDGIQEPAGAYRAALTLAVELAKEN